MAFSKITQVCFLELCFRVQILTDTGMGFLIAAIGVLFVGIQVMFEVREAEMRKGIFLKC